jgi:hypothetical protein
LAKAAPPSSLAEKAGPWPRPGRLTGCRRSVVREGEGVRPNRLCVTSAGSHPPQPMPVPPPAQQWRRITHSPSASSDNVGAGPVPRRGQGAPIKKPAGKSGPSGNFFRNAARLHEGNGAARPIDAAALAQPLPGARPADAGAPPLTARGNVAECHAARHSLLFPASSEITARAGWD